VVHISNGLPDRLEEWLPTNANRVFHCDLPMHSLFDHYQLLLFYVIASLRQSSKNMCAYVVEGEFIMDANTDPLHPDISITTPDENEGGTDLKHTAVERVLRLLLLLAANECTR